VRIDEKYLIIYYSKTGNTNLVAQAIAKKMGDDLCELNDQGVALTSGVDPSSYSLVLVGTPVTVSGHLSLFKGA
jgi:flavodoxin